MQELDIKTTFKLVDGELLWFMPDAHRLLKPRIFSRGKMGEYVAGRMSRIYSLKKVMEVLAND